MSKFNLQLATGQGASEKWSELHSSPHKIIYENYNI